MEQVQSNTYRSIVWYFRGAEEHSFEIFFFYAIIRLLIFTQIT